MCSTMNGFGAGYGAVAQSHWSLQRWLAAWYAQVDQEWAEAHGERLDPQGICDLLMQGRDEVLSWPDPELQQHLVVLEQAYGPDRLRELLDSMIIIVCDQHGVSPAPVSLTTRALQGYGALVVPGLPEPLPDHFEQLPPHPTHEVAAYSFRYQVMVAKIMGQGGPYFKGIWGVDRTGKCVQSGCGEVAHQDWWTVVHEVENKVNAAVFDAATHTEAAPPPQSPPGVEAVFWLDPSAKPREFPKHEHPERPWREWWFKGYGGRRESPFLDTGVPIATEAENEKEVKEARDKHGSFIMPFPLPSTFYLYPLITPTGEPSCPLFHSDTLDMGLMIATQSLPRCGEALPKGTPFECKLFYDWNSPSGEYEYGEEWLDDEAVVGRAILQRWRDRGGTDEQIAKANHWPWRLERKRAREATDLARRQSYVPWYEHPVPGGFHEVARGSDSWPAWYSNELAFAYWINPDMPHLRMEHQQDYRYVADVPRGASMETLIQNGAYTDNWTEIIEAMYDKRVRQTGSPLVGYQGLGAGDGILPIPGVWKEYDFWPEDERGAGLQGLGAGPGKKAQELLRRMQIAEQDVEVQLPLYERVVISSSAGKDSQAMLTRIVELADRQGYPRDRLIVIHADLSELVEWDGTVELAREQAQAYGLRFEVVSRVGQVKTSGAEGAYRMGEQFTPLPDYAERRRMWPGIGQTQYCTSDFKTAPIRSFMTRLADELRGTDRRQVTILSCLGLRAQESARRAQRPALSTLRDNSQIRVDEWVPIKWWSVERVWQTIHASGLPYHHAYDLGMRRLSCCFCIGASLNDLLIAGSANPDKLKEYVAVEDRIGFTFQPNRSLHQVMEELERRGWNVTATSTATRMVEDNEDTNLLAGDTQPCDSWTGEEAAMSKGKGLGSSTEDLDRVAKEIRWRNDKDSYWEGPSDESPKGWWGIITSQTRDSHALEASNFRVIKRDLEARFPGDVEDHHFGHWAVGWVDHLFVRIHPPGMHPGPYTEAFKAAVEWREREEDYPILDENDYQMLSLEMGEHDEDEDEDDE